MKMPSTLLAMLLISAVATSFAAAQPIAPEDDDDLLDVPLMAIGKQMTYLSSFVAQRFPAEKLRFDTVHSVSLKFRNTGTAVWRPGEIVLINIGGRDLLTNSVGLPASVVPGAEVQFDFQVRAECIKEGIFPFQWCRSSRFQYQLTNQGVRFGEASPHLSDLFANGDEGGSSAGTPAPEPGMIDLAVPGGPPPDRVPVDNHPVRWEDF